MLAKENRIVKDRDVKKVLKGGVRKEGKFAKFVCFETTKFGLLIIVPKKVYKKANKRNRVRRRISGIFESLKFQGKLPNNFLCVVNVKNKDIINQKKEVLEADVLSNLAELYFKAHRQKEVDKKR